MPDASFKEGMIAAAKAQCSNCRDGYELYYGYARAEGYSAMKEWRHESHHCRCGAWQIWEDLVKRGLLEHPQDRREAVVV